MTRRLHRQLNFKFDNFVAFGSPIGLFQAIRGQRLAKDLQFRACPRLLNVYHVSFLGCIISHGLYT